MTAHGTLVSAGCERRTAFGAELVVHRFRSLVDGRALHAIAAGELDGEAPLLVRVHSSCVTSEFLGAVDCDCAEQLASAIATIGREGRGVVFYLDQEGRGAGLVAKARDRMLVQASRHRLTTFEAYAAMGIERDLRRYDAVAFAAHLLGIRAPLRLLSNNPEKIAALRALGLPIVSIEPIGGSASPFNSHYLSAKSRAGHAFAPPDGAITAELPEPVEAIQPEPLPGTPEVLRAASYLLPVAIPELGPDRWLRMHVHFDLDEAREIVVTTPIGGSASPPLLRIERERITDRLPGEPSSKARWMRALRRLFGSRAGIALVRSGERVGEGLSRAEIGVLRSLLPPEPVAPLLDGAAPTGEERVLLAGLESAGIALLPPVALESAP